MKRVIIVCEGQTEQEFCEKVLSPYCIERGVYIQSPLIKKNNGGIVQWYVLKKQIENHLKQDSTAYVTLLIDYYGLYKKHEFPGWDKSLIISNKNDRLHFLEQHMRNDIDPKIKHRFIPYMQLHEFEGLLFNNINTFLEQFNSDEIVGINELQTIFDEYPNPEMINDSKETAPSKRLLRIIKGYDKVVYGNILAEAIGLKNIMAKSPRFNDWVKKIIKETNTIRK